MFLSIVLKNELFIEAMDFPTVFKGCQAILPAFGSEEHSIDHKATDLHQHSIRIVVSMVGKTGPANRRGIKFIDLREEKDLLLQFIFCLWFYFAMANKKQSNCLEDLI